VPIKSAFSEFNSRYIFITSNSPPCTWYSNEQRITMLSALYPCVDEDLRMENVGNASTYCTLEHPNNKFYFLLKKRTLVSKNMVHRNQSRGLKILLGSFPDQNDFHNTELLFTFSLCRRLH